MYVKGYAHHVSMLFFEEVALLNIIISIFIYSCYNKTVTIRHLWKSEYIVKLHRIRQQFTDGKRVHSSSEKKFVSVNPYNNG